MLLQKGVCCIYIPPPPRLPDDNILGLPKLKSFADDKLNVTENIKVVSHRIENIAGKEENAGYQQIMILDL